MDKEQKEHSRATPSDVSTTTLPSPPAIEGRANGAEAFSRFPAVAGPPYLADNGFYLGGLFYERMVASTNKRVKPVFSFNDDRDGLINCRKTFVALGDPTGYEWAMKYLKSWVHWERLMAYDWFSDQVTAWRHELSVKQEAEAVAKIIAISKDDTSKAQFQAAKFISDRQKSTSKRGRPTKDEVDGQLKIMAQQESEREADLARVKGMVQ